MAGYRGRLRQLAERYGWKVRSRRNGHLKLTKAGHMPIPCAGSPKCPDIVLRQIERDIARREAEPRP